MNYHLEAGIGMCGNTLRVNDVGNQSFVPDLPMETGSCKRLVVFSTTLGIKSSRESGKSLFVVVWMGGDIGAIGDDSGRFGNERRMNGVAAIENIPATEIKTPAKVIISSWNTILPKRAITMPRKAAISAKIVHLSANDGFAEAN